MTETEISSPANIILFLDENLYYNFLSGPCDPDYSKLHDLTLSGTWIGYDPFAIHSGGATAALQTVM